MTPFRDKVEVAECVRAKRRMFRFELLKGV